MKPPGPSVAAPALDRDDVVHAAVAQMATQHCEAATSAHINPAVTVSLAVVGKLPWRLVPRYLAGQMLGAFFGAVLVWLSYFAHWRETEDQDLKRAVFSTAPAIRHAPSNFATEVVGTGVLVFGVLALGANKPPNDAGLTPLLVGLLVWAIGLSLGHPSTNCSMSSWTARPSRGPGSRRAAASAASRRARSRRSRR